MRDVQGIFESLKRKIFFYESILKIQVNVGHIGQGLFDVNDETHGQGNRHGALH